jgi:hypothetical protein
MKLAVLYAAFLIPCAAAAGGEAEPWVAVRPEVLPAGSVVPRITFEVKMPVETPPGSLVEIEIPFHFGPPQTKNPNAENYVCAESSWQRKLVLTAEVPNVGDYVIRIFAKEKLKPGEKFKLLLTREKVHPFDHKTTAFRTYVKGLPDLKGERPILAAGPTTAVYIPGGPPTKFRVVAPTCVTPGEEFKLKVAALDENHNPPGSAWTGALAISGEGVAGPATAAMSKTDNNYLEVSGFTVSAPGIYRLRVSGGGPEGRSNPIVCRPGWDRRIFWCDEHGHSAFSDGMRQPDEYFDYGRYVALLDGTFLTDHAENIYHGEWQKLLEAANAKNEPPAFVTLAAYEWTSDAWSGGYGHRCVFSRGDWFPFFRSTDEKTDTPEELWANYKPGKVITIPHHTLAGFQRDHFDPAFDRCVEIVSHWGCSEYSGNPFWHNREWPEGGVVDGLNSHYLLGFVGGGDNHNGAPGQNHGPSRMRQMPYYGGITACLLEENTRAAVFDALYDRRVYATAGNRDFIDFRVNGAPMASVVPIKQGPPLVEAEVATEDAIKTVEVVRGGETVYAVPDVQGRDYAKFTWRDEGYGGEPGYYYLRVTSEDGHLAFATPIWVARAAGLEISPAAPRTLTGGATLKLPRPTPGDYEIYAVRLTATAEAPGEVRLISGSKVVATAETAPGNPEITARFRAPSPWDVQLQYAGTTPLYVTDAAVFPYPWKEPD